MVRKRFVREVLQSGRLASKRSLPEAVDRDFLENRRRQRILSVRRKFAGGFKILRAPPASSAC